MKSFTAAAIAIFTVAAIAQLLRAALGWKVEVNGFVIPLWASVIACVVAATLAEMLWREDRKCGPAAGGAA